jgi:hypothetical protein
MKEPVSFDAEGGDYTDGLVSVEKYEYVLPSKKSFRPWHRPRKQFIRNDQWCHFTKLLIEEIQITDGSLTYFGLPGVDLLDLRCFSTHVCEPKSLKLRFLGFDRSANPESEDNTDFSVSLDEISKSATVDPMSDIIGDDLRLLVDEDSVAWQKTFAVGPYDVINLDLCDGFGKQEPGKISPTYYDAVSRLLTVQARRKMPWLLFLTTRVGANHIHADTLQRLTELFAENLKTCQTFADAASDRFEIRTPDALNKAINTAVGIQKVFLISLSKWLLKFSISQSPPSKLEVKSVMGYRVNKDSEVEDMISIAIRFEPINSSPTDAVGLSNIRSVQLDECELATKVVNAMNRLVDVDDILASDLDLREEMIESTCALLEPARYDPEAYRKWAAE